ncbi:THUMP-like domain-containing protein [Jatrophihabitans sp. DSM 45814]
MLPDLDDPVRRRRFEAAIALAATVPETDPVRRVAHVRALIAAQSRSGTHAADGPDSGTAEFTSAELTSAEFMTAAFAQAELRKRASDKFGSAADQLYFTSDGLQQSTRREVADHRADRFERAGLATVLDLCCGIGADALAFERAGLVVEAVEREPATAQIARANLAAGAAGDAGPARVIVGAAEDADWSTAESVFIDPSRRSARGRTFDPAAYSPAFDFVTEVIRTATWAAAKLGPGLDHALIPPGVEAEWTSFRAGVKEAVLWSRGFTEPSVTRRATVLSALRPKLSLTDADPAETAIGAIGSYLYEPDGAIIRAGLVQQAAAVLGGWRIDEHLAYLSTDQAPNGTWNALAKGYRVLETLPYSVKRLRTELRRREVGIVEIKKRGVDIDPAVLRRELKPSGPNSITVLLARVGEKRLAVLAEPVGIPTGRHSDPDVYRSGDHGR